jgi:histone chaperone ASF1
MVDDSEAAGVEGVAAEESDDGSEDLEGESSGSEGEEDEDEVEADVDEAMEVDGVEKPVHGTNGDHPMDEVMAH